MFDTIATEAQRLLNENFSMFVRNFLPRYAQPDADAIENLSMAIVVDQKRLGGGSHSTMGTITDIYAVLRLLFSRVGQPFVGLLESSFRSTIRRACARNATGSGARWASISENFLDMSKSLNEGAVQVPFFGDWERMRTRSAASSTTIKSWATTPMKRWICCCTARIRSLKCSLADRP